MSFTITTDVFCDFCILWMVEGGITGPFIEKKNAWAKAKSLKWKLKNRKHMCPDCQEKEGEKP